MELSAVLGFAAVAFALIAVPGPDWAYVLAAGARNRVVGPAVGGLLVGYTLITALVVVGVGSLVAAVPFLLPALTLGGAAYLIHLGMRILRSPTRVGADTGVLASSPGGYFLRGIGVSGFNPKGLLIFLAILPQFARSTGGWPLPAQFAVLGGVFVAIAAVFYLPLGFTAHRVLAARPGVARVTSKIAGTAMIILGVVLLVEQAAAAGAAVLGRS